MKSLEQHKKEVAKIKADSNRKDVDLLKYKKSKLDGKYWLQQIKRRIRQDRTFIINMELNNKFHKTFLITEKNSFIYQSKEYIIDKDLAYYNVVSKSFCLDYHESFTLPIKRELPTTDILKTLDSEELDSKIIYSTNPQNLRHFTKSNVIEQILKSTQLDVAFKRITLIVIVIMIISAIHIMLYMYQSGFFKQITG